MTFELCPGEGDGAIPGGGFDPTVDLIAARPGSS